MFGNSGPQASSIQGKAENMGAQAAPQHTMSRRSWKTMRINANMLAGSASATNTKFAAFSESGMGTLSRLTMKAATLYQAVG